MAKLVNCKSCGKEVAKSAKVKKIEYKIPALQKKFCDNIEAFYSEYKNASNELKKSNVRRKRKEKIKKTLNSLNIKNWVGKLDSFGTNSDGKAFISIQPFDTDFLIKTWNNALSDIRG